MKKIVKIAVIAVVVILAIALIAPAALRGNMSADRTDLDQIGRASCRERV